MVWAILAFLGVPLWLCAAGITVVLLENRSLRKRPGDLVVRLRTKPGGRWHRGHGIWVHDTFAFRSSPASWREHLSWVTEVSANSRRLDDSDDKPPRWFGDDPAIFRFHTADGEDFDVAVHAQDSSRVKGPFADDPDKAGLAASHTARALRA